MRKQNDVGIIQVTGSGNTRLYAECWERNLSSWTWSTTFLIVIVRKCIRKYIISRRGAVGPMGDFEAYGWPIWQWPWNPYGSLLYVVNHMVFKFSHVVQGQTWTQPP